MNSKQKKAIKDIEAAKKCIVEFRCDEKDHKWEHVYYPKWSTQGGLFRARCKICGYEID